MLTSRWQSVIGEKCRGFTAVDEIMGKLQCRRVTWKCDTCGTKIIRNYGARWVLKCQECVKQEKEPTTYYEDLLAKQGLKLQYTNWGYIAEKIK